MILIVLAVLILGAMLFKFFQAKKKSRSFSKSDWILSLIWVIALAYEIIMIGWSKEVIAPIRVDLVFLVPILIFLTLGFFLFGTLKTEKKSR